MADFMKIIDRAIARDMHSQFRKFLRRHKPCGRELSEDEFAIVLHAFDAFLATRSLTSLGSVEFQRLHERLADAAESEHSKPLQLVRNTCFDALACLKALEGRLCCAVDRTEARHSMAAARASWVANDW